MATSSNSKTSILQPRTSKSSSSSSSKSNQNSNSSISTSTSSYSSIYVNPLTNLSPTNGDKENVGPAVVDPAMGCGGFKKKKQKEQQAAAAAADLESAADSTSGSSLKEAKPLKPSSLQLCMKLDDSNKWDPIATSSSSDVWDFSDSEAAPASSWSALPNRSLLCRPLPLDIGKCTCIIVKESVLGIKGISTTYSLYTNEGHGRQDRKLAMARHTRHNGRSKFVVAQNINGLISSSDESFLGLITANLMGSKFQIWDQARTRNSMRTQPKKLLGVVVFVPTITTCTGSFRIMMAWIPKQQSIQLKNFNSNTAQVNHAIGLPKDWEERRKRAHQLFSREPYYNKLTKRYELDFREISGRTAPKIQTSVKNFQLTLEEHGKQTLLQLGKIGKSQYLMDYRYPLTAYQAFCICLSSIDSKLCCSV